jgi:hypothetical protein
MVNHAYVVVVSIPKATELFVVVGSGEEDVRQIMSRRAGASSGEYISVCAALDDNVAEKLGADLSRHGMHANFTPSWPN